ncbi:MAG: hypothetical protein LBT07_00805 [Endomicrobium sp.]|jgi:type III restriction enzyme|nr:hypothetical protein [Endomicrobium sp.]
MNKYKTLNSTVESLENSYKTVLKEFQYENQSYQEDCVHNIVSIFEQIKFNKPFKEGILQHLSKFKYPYQPYNNKNIDILMETGTGKTFT